MCEKQTHIKETQHIHTHTVIIGLINKQLLGIFISQLGHVKSERLEE